MAFNKLNSVMRLTAVVIFLLLMSCAERKSPNNVNNEINIRNLQEIDYISITDKDFIDSYSVVKLQSEKSLINNIDQIQIFNDNIYILDKRQYRVLVFTSEGEYIQDIGRHGQAHNEFIAVSSFYINPDKLTINIVDPLKNTVLSYDLVKQGNFIGEKQMELKIAGPIANIRYIGNGKIICYSNPNIFDDNILYVVNEDDFSVNYIIFKSPFSPDVGAAIIATQPYSVVSEDLHFVSIFEKEIQSYSNRSIRPILLVENNKRIIKEKELEAIATVNSNNYISTLLSIIKDGNYSPGFKNLFETQRFILCASFFM